MWGGVIKLMDRLRGLLATKSGTVRHTRGSNYSASQHEGAAGPQAADPVTGSGAAGGARAPPSATLKTLAEKLATLTKEKTALAQALSSTQDKAVALISALAENADAGRGFSELHKLLGALAASSDSATLLSAESCADACKAVEDIRLIDKQTHHFTRALLFDASEICTAIREGCEQRISELTSVLTQELEAHNAELGWLEDQLARANSAVESLTIQNRELLQGQNSNESRIRELEGQLEETMSRNEDLARMLEAARADRASELAAYTFTSIDGPKLEDTSSDPYVLAPENGPITQYSMFISELRDILAKSVASDSRCSDDTLSPKVSKGTMACADIAAERPRRVDFLFAPHIYHSIVPPEDPPDDSVAEFLDAAYKRSSPVNTCNHKLSSLYDPETTAPLDYQEPQFFGKPATKMLTKIDSVSRSAGAAESSMHEDPGLLKSKVEGLMRSYFISSLSNAKHRGPQLRPGMTFVSRDKLREFTKASGH